MVFMRHLEDDMVLEAFLVHPVELDAGLSILVDSKFHIDVGGFPGTDLKVCLGMSLREDLLDI